MYLCTVGLAGYSRDQMSIAREMPVLRRRDRRADLRPADPLAGERRRDRLHRVPIPAGGIAAGSGLGRRRHGQGPRNILFVMCDQLRADYLGCTGHPSIPDAQHRQAGGPGG